MRFVKKYPNLQKGRWFHTVWVSLPEETRPIIEEITKELVPYCKWISTQSNDHSKDIPHITLRYLGHSDELFAEKVKRDLNLFKYAVKNTGNNELTLGKVALWTRKNDNGEVVVANLNWEILDKSSLVELHELLLEIPDYYYFEALEGNNYTPHISLGSINLDNPENLEKVEEILYLQTEVEYKFILKNIGLNLTTPDFSEVVNISE